MSKKNKKYDDEREKGFKIERQLALADIKPWIERLSKDELDKPHVIMGHKTFTPRQILKEIEDSTEDGRYFVQMLINQRLELAKKKGEISV